MAPRTATALYSYNLRLPNCVTVVAGDALRVWTEYSNDEWCYVECLADGNVGYLPPSHVLYDDERLCAHDDNYDDGTDENGGTVDYWQNGEFFDSYSALKIHHEMLGDVPRTDAYRRAIEAQAAGIKDRVVMDVGCGTGILSMMAARSGAKRVYAIEASALANDTRAVVVHNKLDNVVQVVQGLVEQVKLGDMVDVIVSEWMGTFLIFENMIESVLVARDRFLKPDGWMMPSHAKVLLAPASAQDLYRDRIDFWKDQYGIDMTPLKNIAFRNLASKPIFDHVGKQEDLLASAVTMRAFDMLTVTVEELKLHSFAFDFEVNKDGPFHGFMSWFDVSFERQDAESVVLSTGPGLPLTHWKHTFLLWHDTFDVKQGDRIKGTIVTRKNPVWHRHFVIEVKMNVSSNADAKKYEGAQLFLLWR